MFKYLSPMFIVVRGEEIFIIWNHVWKLHSSSICGSICELIACTSISGLRMRYEEMQTLKHEYIVCHVSDVFRRKSCSRRGVRVQSRSGSGKDIWVGGQRVKGPSRR